MPDTVYLLEGARRIGAIDLVQESERIASRYEWLTVGDQLAFETCVDGCLFAAQPVGVRPAGGCLPWIGLGLLGGILAGKKAGTLVTGVALVGAAYALRQGRLDFALDWITNAGNS